jgi:putative ATP-binding cassette transporter
MNFVTLLRRHGSPSLGWMAFAFVLTAGLQLGLGVMTTIAADMPDGDARQGRDVGLLLVGCLLFYIAQTRLLRQAMDHVADALRGAGERIVGRLCDDAEPADAVAAVSLLADPGVPAALASSLVLAVQSLIMVVCGLAYLSTVSTPACIVASVALLLIVVIQLLGHFGMDKPFETIREHQCATYGGLQALAGAGRRLGVDGPSRTKLEGRMKDQFGAIAALQRASHPGFAQDNAMQQVVYFLLIGVLVFGVPLVEPDFRSDMLGAVAVTIFLFAPLSSALNNLPLFDAAEAAAGHLLRLESHLAADARRSATAFEDFAVLTLDGVRIPLPECSDELAGPFDMVIDRGGFAVISGPSGSGKSLLADILTGLAEPAEGRVWVDRTVVTAENRQGLRDLCALADGGRDIDPTIWAVSDDPKVIAIVDGMRLSARERIALHRPTVLSSGQSAHVAVARAVLSGRPVILLDSVLDSADEAWRRHFLSAIVPALRANGRTVILVTRLADLCHGAEPSLALHGRPTC